jgi:hypothetical protein
MYVRPDGSYCFQPTDPSCDDSAYQPLSCNEGGHYSDSSSDYPSQDDSYGTDSSDDSADDSQSSQSYAGDYCQMKCDSLESCSMSKYGSYCKTDLSMPVCFGILVRDDGTYCFEPTDPECDDSKYQPLSCDNYNNADSNQADHAYDYGSSQDDDKADDQSYDESYCQSTCDSLSDCASSKYGSYCNMNMDMPSCFGILVRDDGSYCFEPTDPDCNDQVYKPLSCSYNSGDYSNDRHGRSLRGNVSV